MPLRGKVRVAPISIENAELFIVPRVLPLSLRIILPTIFCSDRFPRRRHTLIHSTLEMCRNVPGRSFEWGTSRPLLGGGGRGPVVGGQWAIPGGSGICGLGVCGLVARGPVARRPGGSAARWPVASSQWLVPGGPVARCVTLCPPTGAKARRSSIENAGQLLSFHFSCLFLSLYTILPAIFRSGRFLRLGQSAFLQRRRPAENVPGRNAGLSGFLRFQTTAPSC